MNELCIESYIGSYSLLLEKRNSISNAHHIIASNCLLCSISEPELKFTKCYLNNMMHLSATRRVVQRLHYWPFKRFTRTSLTNPIRRSDIATQEGCSESGNGWRESYGSSHHSDTGKASFFGTVGATTLALTGIIAPRHSPADEPPRDNPNLVDGLFQAVVEGDERRVELLAKRCSVNDINSRHRFGWQMLHVAAINGQARICETLLKNGARVNDIDHFTTPGQMSEKFNMDPIMILLIRDTEFSPDLRRVSAYGCTALHYAALANDSDTLEVLMKYGADPTVKNELGFKPAKFANPSTEKRLMQYEDEFVKRLKEIEMEEKRRYPLEQRIKEHLVGQDAAIKMVAATIRRKENGWFDEDHPLVFLFLGSSGIGKTELAKQVAKYLHKDQKNAFIRLDMSEYQESHSVARMIGSPPGYVGYQDGGQLTDALKKCPSAVVLFDEVEKAHPKVLTVLLQLFDEGRMTDGKGNTIECKDAIFIMTSNLASEAIAEHAMQLRNEQQAVRDIERENILRGFTSPSDDNYKEQITISRKFKDTIVRPVLKAHFQRDEFLGRINEMVYFLPFSEQELRQLVVKELQFWAARAKKKNSIEMTWDKEVVDVICKGYDIHYGARSIKHEVERRIVNQISELHSSVQKVKKVHISVNHDPNEASIDLIGIKIN